jgi:hypothetical protein
MFNPFIGDLIIVDTEMGECLYEMIKKDENEKEMIYFYSIIF